MTFSIENIRANGFGSPDRVDALVWGLTELFPKIAGRRKVEETVKEYTSPPPKLNSSTGWMVG